MSGHAVVQGMEVVRAWRHEVGIGWCLDSIRDPGASLLDLGGHKLGHALAHVGAVGHKALAAQHECHFGLIAVGGLDIDGHLKLLAIGQLLRDLGHNLGASQVGGQVWGSEGLDTVLGGEGHILDADLRVLVRAGDEDRAVGKKHRHRVVHAGNVAGHPFGKALAKRCGGVVDHRCEHGIITTQETGVTSLAAVQKHDLAVGQNNSVTHQTGGRHHVHLPLWVSVVQVDASAGLEGLGTGRHGFRATADKDFVSVVLGRVQGQEHVRASQWVRARSSGDIGQLLDHLVLLDVEDNRLLVGKDVEVAIGKRVDVGVEVVWQGIDHELHKVWLVVDGGLALGVDFPGGVVGCITVDCQGFVASSKDKELTRRHGRDRDVPAVASHLPVSVSRAFDPVA